MFLQVQKSNKARKKKQKLNVHFGEITNCFTRQASVTNCLFQELLSYHALLEAGVSSQIMINWTFASRPDFAQKQKSKSQNLRNRNSRAMLALTTERL